MKFIKLTLNNFMSFENTTLDFRSGITLISGHNKESDRSNGSGKSSIFLSIFWVLYSSLTRSISSTEVVRYGEKNCSVSLEFSYKGKVFEVTRARGTKSKFTCLVDGELIEEKEFLTLIPSLYKFEIAMHSQNSVRFLQLTDTQKKDILMSLVDFSTEDALEKMKNDMKELSKNSIKLSSRREFIAETIKDLDNEKYDLTKEEKTLILAKKDLPSILELREKYKSLKASLISKDDGISEEIAKLKNNINELSGPQVLERAIKDNEAIKKRIAEVFEEPLGDSIKCPSCSSSFIPGKEELEKIRDFKINKLKSNLSSDEVITNLKRDIKTREKLQQDLKTLTLKNEESSSNKTSLMKQIEEVQSLGSELKLKVTMFEKDTLNAKNLLVESEELNSKLKKLEKEQELLQNAIDTLSPSGVSSYITELVLNQVNSFLYEHIQLLFPHISFEFTSQSELKSGKTSTKLGEILFIEGRQASIGSLSGGEFRALSLATDLAIMRTMEVMSGLKFETLLFDEPFDGLDVTGRVAAVNLLQCLSELRDIILIEHASEVGSFNQNLFLVSKEGNTSHGRYT